MPKPRAILIAGPNGAGKSTFAEAFLPRVGVERFLNADHLARGLSPLAPEEAALPAGRLLLGELRAAVAARVDFATETTLAGKSHLRHARAWQTAGYEVQLIFLRLSSAKVARRRVAQRVIEGGHGIPADVIDRRHAAGWANFEAFFRGVVDRWSVYDADETPPRLVASGRAREQTGS